MALCSCLWGMLRTDPVLACVWFDWQDVQQSSDEHSTVPLLFLLLICFIFYFFTFPASFASSECLFSQLEGQKQLRNCTVGFFFNSRACFHNFFGNNWCFLSPFLKKHHNTQLHNSSLSGNKWPKINNLGLTSRKIPKAEPQVSSRSLVSQKGEYFPWFVSTFKIWSHFAYYKSC